MTQNIEYNQKTDHFYSTHKAPFRKGSMEDCKDSLGLYLEQIGRIALLSASDEIDISQRIETGLYAQKILEASEERCPIDGVQPRTGLTTSQMDDLIYLARDGELAKSKMIESNLRLVVSLAKRHTRRSGAGMPLVDLIQEGNIGLMRAVEKFDYKKGYKFSTYAAWWIKQYMARGALNQGHLIRLPESTNNILIRIVSAQEELGATLGREVSPEEIADKLDLSVCTVEELLAISKIPLSLDSPVVEGGATLYDLISSQESNVNFENEIDLLNVREYLDHTIRESLSELEYKVIELRFGLNGHAQSNLTDIAKTLGLYRQLTSKIEKDALRKLRRVGVLEELRKLVYQ